jgi:hypothetical protein
MSISISTKHGNANGTMKFLCFIGILILVTFALYSCKPKSSDNPGELITTVKLTFSEGGNSKTFEFKDLDGLGSGLDGIADTIRLDTAKTYQLTVGVLDESTTPIIVTSDEIRSEGIDHQFFYTISNGLQLSQTYDDVDAKGQPIGLSNIVMTRGSSSGTLNVNLKHQPGIKDGHQATGESDIDITFQAFLK